MGRDQRYGRGERLEDDGDYSHLYYNDRSTLPRGVSHAKLERQPLEARLARFLEEDFTRGLELGAGSAGWRRRLVARDAWAQCAHRRACYRHIDV